MAAGSQKGELDMVLWRDCDDCAGGGVAECSYCEGSGNESLYTLGITEGEVGPCDYCDGGGYEDCDTCEGAGGWYAEGEDDD